MTMNRAAIAILVLALSACRSPVVLPSDPPPPTTALASPSAAAPGTVEEAEWVPQPEARTLAGARVEKVVDVGDGFIAVGCHHEGEVCVAPSAWRSADGVAWGERIDLPVEPGEGNPRATAAAQGPAGTIIGGTVLPGASGRAVLWRSTGADRWERVSRGAAFADAGVAAIVPVGQGFAAVGSGVFTEAAGFRAWSSAEGARWADATPPGQGEAFATGILHSGEGLVAWGPTCGVCPPETAWWSSRTGDAWRGGGVAAGLQRVFLADVVALDDRFVGVGSMLEDDGDISGGVWEQTPGEAHWSRVAGPTLPPGTSSRFSSWTAASSSPRPCATPAATARSSRAVRPVVGRGSSWRPSTT
jgi:hypothetical protein